MTENQKIVESALRARIAQLESALKPFADYADTYPVNHPANQVPDDFVLFSRGIWHDHATIDREITLSHVKNAATVLQGAKLPVRPETYIKAHFRMLMKHGAEMFGTRFTEDLNELAVAPDQVIKYVESVL